MARLLHSIQRARRWSWWGCVATLLLGLSATGCVDRATPPLTVWAVGDHEALTHDSPPAPENAVYSASRREIDLVAALNETVAFQLAVRTDRPPAGPFRLDVSDLTGPGGTIAARDAVTIYRTHDVRVETFPSWYPAHTGRPATPTLVPDILVPWLAPEGGGPLRLSEARNEILWVDLRVPLTVAPGVYRGAVSLRSERDGASVFGCALEVEVVPVALPGRRNLPVYCRVDPRDLLREHLRWTVPPTAEATRLLPDAPSHFSAVRIVNETMRTFQAHRATPILWAAFPKFRPTGVRDVELWWDEYDRLVEGWLDGSAFVDRDRLEHWPLPVSIDYPDPARHGGLASPQYARLLGAYLAECQRHFEERGWLDRAFVRMCPPGPITPETTAQLARVSAILQQSEVTRPLVAHLPARSLRGLGWHGAPPIDVPDVGVWAPPAMGFEPEAMQRERTLGRQTWFQPDRPPYSGSLAVGAPLADPWMLPWMAWRYNAGAVWVENAAGRRDEGAGDPIWPQVAGDSLVYPGETYGRRDEGPVPSMRLKRLRRGLQDYELLRLLEENGERLLAQNLASQVIRWAATDACLENLLTTQEAGWPRRGDLLRQTRLLMLRELTSRFRPSPAAEGRQLASLSEWALIFNQAERVAVRVDGVRLAPARTGLRAVVETSVTNATNREINGVWTAPNLPPGWRAAADVAAHVAAGGYRAARFDLDLDGLAYNTEGVYPFDLVLRTEELGAFQRQARLAVAACPRFDDPPRIDGRLDDWRLASSNAAGDFRLVHGRHGDDDRPTLGTRAFFGMDEQHLYVGVRCDLPPGERPLWQADNRVPVDGAIPWGQDVVEILIDPRATAAGRPDDLCCLQIKPSGLLLATRGCRTEPPIATVTPWASGARVAVEIGSAAWMVEVALPWSAFPPTARQAALWGLNVTRLDARRGEYSSWSGAQGHCYSTRSLGNLLIIH